MRGLRIWQVYRNPGENFTRSYSDLPESSFPCYFEPILADLAKFWWLFYDWPITAPSPDAPDYDDFFDHVTEEFAPWVRQKCAAPGVLLPRFARYIKDNQNSLYGTRTKPAPLSFFVESNLAEERDWERVRHLFEGALALPWEKACEERIAIFRNEGSHEGRFLSDHLDLLFENEDGVYWEFYAHDSCLIDAVRNHVVEDLGVRYEEISLEGA